MAIDRADLRSIAWVALLAGIWLLISPLVLGYTGVVPAVWNNVIVGILLVLLVAYTFFGRAGFGWPEWAMVVLGLWLIVSPWVLGYSGKTPALWNDVIVGIIVGLIGAYGVYGLRGRRGLFRFR